MKTGIQLCRMIVTSSHSESGCHENSMLSRPKFASLISWDLSSFDRVIFKGHLPFSYASKFAASVDYQLKMRRADFMEVVAPAWPERLVEHSKAYAKKHDRFYEYYQGDMERGGLGWARTAQ